MRETVKSLGGSRVRIEPMECPKCGNSETRIINKRDLFCLNCGEWSDPYTSPSFKRALKSYQEGRSFGSGEAGGENASHGKVD